VKHDDTGATIRVMRGVDVQFPQAQIRRASYLSRSFMIPGLLEGLDEQQVADLISFIRTLKEDTNSNSGL
jgi:hypothetical protein